nr:trna wybutosine-synthesizing protein 2/3/4 [Quercus suber]
MFPLTFDSQLSSRWLCLSLTTSSLLGCLSLFSLTPSILSQRANAKLVYACEWNPNAIEALQHNLQANSVSDRCIVLEGDNQITAPKAWKLWNENRAMELMDALMEKPTPASEVLRWKTPYTYNVTGMQDVPCKLKPLHVKLQQFLLPSINN